MKWIWTYPAVCVCVCMVRRVGNYCWGKWHVVGVWQRDISSCQTPTTHTEHHN